MGFWAVCIIPGMKISLFYKTCNWEHTTVKCFETHEAYGLGLHSQMF